MLALVIIAAAASHAAAQRLPFTTYTAVQGLAGDSVSTAIEDAQGFLWIGTDRGLSRFDGIGFRIFDRRHGLRNDDVTSIAIDRNGTMWIGAWGAAYRFDGRTFTEIPVEGKRAPWERVHLAIDAQDRVWCGADGLYRVENAATAVPVLRRFGGLRSDALPLVDALLADQNGNVWAGASALYRVTPSDEVSRVDANSRTSRAGIVWLAETPAGRIWMATAAGVEYVDCYGSGSSSRCLFSSVTDVPLTRSNRVLPKADGGVWIGSNDGLFETDPAGRVLRRISRRQGLVSSPCWPMLIDRSGDLWIGSDSGVQRLAAADLEVFGPSEGLEATQVASIFATRAGEVVVDATPQVLQRLDNGRFVPTRPLLPRGIGEASWGWYQIDLQDHTGEWWIPTAGGLVRFPAADRPDQLARERPIAVYTNAGCFRGRDIFRLYEDTRGDIWISTVERGRESLYRWNRSSATFDCFNPGSIVGENVSPTAFLDDGRGTLWIGFGHGQVARYRDGRFECVMDCGAGTYGLIHALLIDSEHRLWIAAAKAGLFRLDRPEDGTVKAVRLTTREGLSSNVVTALAADRYGRIYVGTDHGVDVLDAQSRAVRHFGTEDGLPHPHVTSAWTDPRGDVWFGTLNGVARFTPPARLSDPPRARILLAGVRVSGVALPFSAMGQDRIGGVVLASDQREMEIDIVGLPRAAAAGLQFQYRRSPAEKWSLASSNRTLILAGLSGGSYQYEIRAVGPTGIASSNTVVVAFRVLTPIYRRSWFLALAAGGALALAFAVYRIRVARLVALERLRAQIAMDLHDEMGSRLGSIGLLADLAAERGRGGGDGGRLLDQIGEVASELGSSLADIVWSLREDEMTVESLARHLAERGRRLFPDPARVLVTHFPATWPQVSMSPGARRNAFLVGLEALHNAARHSHATRVTLGLQPVGRNWQLTVADDGTGMDNGGGDRLGSGFGLDGMKRRASMIGATLEIQSHCGTGTTVSLVFSPRAESRDARLI